MIDRQTIVHDLTLMIVKEQTQDKSPETLINAYFETQLKVEAAYKNYSKNIVREGKVLDRSEWGI